MGDGVLVIELELAGFDDIMRKLTQLANQMKQLGQGVGSPAAGIRQVGSASQSALGPMQRLINAQRQFYQSAAGTPAQQFDAQFRLLRAQQAFQRAQSALTNPVGDFGRKLHTLISSMRIGVGSGGLSAMPLVGRLTDTLGSLAPEMAALVDPVTALVIGFGAMFTAVDNFTQMLTRFLDAKNATGASLAEMNKAMVVGAAVGMSPSDMGQMAQQLAGRLGTKQGMVAGAALHLFDPMGGTMFGKPDQMDTLLKAVKEIASMKDARAATVLARTLGLEQLLRLRDMSPNVRDRVLNGMQSGAFTKDQMRTAVDFQANLGVVMTDLLKFGTALLPFADLFNELTPFIRADLQILRFELNVLTSGVKGLADAMMWVREKIEAVFGKPGGAGDKQQKAADKVAAAMSQHAADMKQIFGGGKRARGAMPLMPVPGLASPNQMAAARARRLGAFEL